MRILMLNYEYPPLGGGASPFTGALAHQLAQANHDVDVVTMGFRDLPAFEQHGSLRVHRVPAWRRSAISTTTPEMFSYLPSALVKASLLARQCTYDVVHGHFILPTGPLTVPLSRLLRVPSVITVHGSDVPGYNPDRWKHGHRLFAPTWRWIVRNTDAIISPSVYLRDLLTSHYEVPVETIPYGFSVPSGFDTPRRKRLLFASRLFPRKGGHLLLDALVGLPLDGWEIIIAGDGPELPALTAQAQRLGLPVQFPGFVKGPALEALYASSAIFAFPSLTDNFPVVLLEALSAGCAVITSNISGMPEVVGDAGLLVPPGDVVALRAAIGRLVENEELRELYSRRAVVRGRSFSWEHVIERHVALYQRVVSDHAARGRVSVAASKKVAKTRITP